MAKKMLTASTLEVIAATICGSGCGPGAAEYTAPGVYCSKAEICVFFGRANAPARGQSSTRKWFVLESLQDLNQENGDLVSRALENVILRLANPQEYRGDMQITQGVMNHLNRALILEGLEVVLDGVRPRLREVQAGVLALLISTISGVVAAGYAFVSTIFIGAKLFNDEMSYGVPLSVGLELTSAVELLLFLGVVHFGVEINLGDFKRFVPEPVLDFH